MFTSRPFSGNGLAVVHDSDDLDHDAMLAFARETRLSETAFVQSPSEPGADYRNRIFSVAEELPFAGHPSLGTAVAIARIQGQQSAHFVQQTLAGLQPITVQLTNYEATAWMLQQQADLGKPEDPLMAAAALSLTASQIHAELPVCTGSTGLRHLLVPMADRASLRAAVPALSPHRELAGATGALVVYAFAVERDRLYARGFFDDGTGIAEDPATGSAAGPLAAYARRYLGRETVQIAQGEEIGRPSMIEAEVTTEGIRVGGNVVVIMDGELAV